MSRRCIFCVTYGSYGSFSFVVRYDEIQIFLYTYLAQDFLALGRGSFVRPIQFIVHFSVIFLNITSIMINHVSMSNTTRHIVTCLSHLLLLHAHVIGYFDCYIYSYWEVNVKKNLHYYRWMRVETIVMMRIVNGMVSLSEPKKSKRT